MPVPINYKKQLKIIGIHMSHFSWPFRCFHTKLKRKLKSTLNIFAALLLFVYLNYRFNMPVFHVFRNKNVQSPCLLPKYDLYDPEIDHFFWKQEPLPCEEWRDLFFVNSSGFLLLNNTAVKLSTFTDISCKYRYISRVSEKEMKFSPYIEFSEPFYIEGDFLHVECIDPNHNVVYNNVHTSVDTRRLKQHGGLRNETSSELSVYILGLDSVSRLIAKRKMPRTMKYLKETLNAHVLEGYTRTDDSSYPNLVSLLTGLRPLLEDSMGVNKLPYIFKNFSQRGAVDIWIEDWYKVASFKGFQEQPTAHYLEPMLRAMDEVRPYNLEMSMVKKFLQFHNIPIGKVSAMCFGNKYRFEIAMNYLKQFIDMYHPIRKFAFSWINELAHDFFNMVELADNYYYELIKWMKDSGKLDNGVLIVMGDHGPRYSEIQNTEVGRISNLLPLMAVRLPEHLLAKYPLIDKNLKSNIHRLTTSYDVYEMFKDILLGDFEPNNRHYDTGSIPRGISLFQEIPSQRSCKDSAISEHFCPCYASERFPKDDKRVMDSVNKIVKRINSKLKKFQDKCAKLELSSVLDVSRIFADMERDQQRERSYSLRSFLWTIKERNRLRIKLETNPGGGVFESTVQYTDKNDIKILGDVIRVNKYGNQSKCIESIAVTVKEERKKMMYCYCK